MLIAGNWIDLVIILFIIFYFWEGSLRGFINLFFEFLGFLIAFIFGLASYATISGFLISNFSLPHGLSNSLSFAGVMLSILPVCSYVFGKLEERIPNKALQHQVNKIFTAPPLLGNLLILFLTGTLLSTALPYKAEMKQAVTSSYFVGKAVVFLHDSEVYWHTIIQKPIVNTFNFLTVNPNLSEKVSLHFTQKDVETEPVLAQELGISINALRMQNNLPVLVYDPVLAELAVQQGKNVFGAGVMIPLASENVALAPTIQLAQHGFMDSPVHRDILLFSGYKKMGVGVVDGGIYGKIIVEAFAD